MHISDESARSASSGDAGGASTSDSSEGDQAAPRCGAIRKRTGTPCRNYAVTGGRCRWHLVDELVPEDELETLRQLEAAAAQHALDAHHALQGGENGDQDQAFNRNARTAAQIARIRRDLVRRGEPPPKETGEDNQIEVPGNGRDPPEK